MAERVGLELANIHPRPPALRVFDAGFGDGTVLARVMRAMHGRFPHMPFYIAGKELSLEDVRLTLDKVPDRLFEHPATVFVFTNMNYAEAPWLTPTSPAAAAGMIWHEVPLRGASSGEFETQIAELGPFLQEHWRANVSPRSGMPVYERPVAMVAVPGRSPVSARFGDPPGRPDRGQFRPDHRLAALSGQILREFPRQAHHRAAGAGAACRRPADRDSLPRRQDPGLEIIQAVWPGENPFSVSRHELLRAVKYELGSAGRNLNFNAYADNRSIFRYDMEALPNEVTGSIGNSTAFAAWNAAVYVAQIEDDRLTEMTQSGQYSRCHQRGFAQAQRALVLRRILRHLAPSRLTFRDGQHQTAAGSGGNKGLVDARVLSVHQRVGFRGSSGQGLRPDFRRGRRSVLPRGPEGRHRSLGDPRRLRDARNHQQGGDRRRDPRARFGHQRPDRERGPRRDQGHRLRAGRLPLEDLRHRDPAASAIGRHRAGRRRAAARHQQGRGRRRPGHHVRLRHQ